MHTLSGTASTLDPPRAVEGEIAACLRHLGVISALTFTDNNTAIQKYLATCAQIMGMRTAFISQFLPGGQCICNVVDDEGCHVVAGTTVELQDTFCQYVLASNGPITISDVAHDPRVRELISLNGRIGSYIGVPLLLRDGSMYGTLCVMDPNPRHFTIDHVAVLRIIARHIVAIIESSQQSSRTLVEVEEPPAHQDSIIDALNAQTRLVQVVAHDVRSPLMIINGYADLLKDEGLGEFTPDQLDALEHIQQASQFINRLMNDLMNVNALKEHSLSLITDQFDAIALVRHIIAAYQPEAEAQHVTLSLSTTLNTLAMIGDRDRLQQVLLNLISNALRYAPHGWVRIIVTMSGDDAEFRVEDSGPGIAPEIQSQIWACYTRGTTRGKGFGIGLYVVQHLVEAMGGTVGMASELGQGSQFWARLPLKGQRPQQIVWQ